MGRHKESVNLLRSCSLLSRQKIALLHYIRGYAINRACAEKIIGNVNGFVCPHVRMRASSAVKHMKMGFPSVLVLFMCIYLYMYVRIRSCLFYVICTCYIFSSMHNGIKMER